MGNENITVVRPRFLIHSKLSIGKLEELLKLALEKQHFPCYGSVAYGYAVIKISKKIQHFWSPQLSISMEQDGDKTIVRGLFGPKPSIWTMFMFFYAIVGFSTLIVGILGLSRQSLGKSTEILWLVPLGLVVLIGIYFVSASGKKIGKDQLLILHQFFADATGLDTNEKVSDSD